MSTYTLNERPYTLYHSVAEDLRFEPEQTYVFDLAHLGALQVSGDNAAQFLQGQLTCDMAGVTDQQMRPSGLCSLQGRLLALMDVVQWQSLNLIMPQDLLPLTQQSLSKAALFSRVTLKIMPQYSCVGLYIPQRATPEQVPVPFPTAIWQVTQNPNIFCYALSEQMFVFLFRDTPYKESFLEQFSAQQHRGSLAWHYLELQLPRLSIYPNTRGLFLPHRLNLHTTPYLSFSKGCYKGQEIIARTHYRAKLKHSLKLLQITTPHPISAGQKCYATPGQTEIGEIIDYCPLNSEEYLIVLSILTEHPDTIYIEQHPDSLIIQRDDSKL